MDNQNHVPQLTEEQQKKFEEGLVETRWTEAGEPYFVIEDGLNLDEFALLAKAVLESKKEIAHDFTSKVIRKSGEEEVTFKYHSGWFLEGLGELPLN
ncbi:hypothetical protein [Pedobacter sp. GR22-10]|uniref:hypothetical protein n=1 Tax=Pedobacter sp. GR22-10 TaxID=2994472 RepID=UPI002247CFE5|nr:hypothetical protein [Pedobacter sp. GR22-10]MCX2431379.1 hypothetical protein [Pedobacter sp. GR22-10]